MTEARDALKGARVLGPLGWPIPSGPFQLDRVLSSFEKSFQGIRFLSWFCFPSSMKAQAVLVLEGREEGGRPSLHVSSGPTGLGKDLPQNRGTRRQPGHAPKSSGGSRLCSPISWVHFLPISRVVLAY